MCAKWDEIRNRINDIPIMGDNYIQKILLTIIEELEEISNEVHQGYTKPE